jgi:hypothetical protein
VRPQVKAERRSPTLSRSRLRGGCLSRAAAIDSLATVLLAPRRGGLVALPVVLEPDED